MYLHNILQKNPSEMIRKIFETQKQNPSPGDFYEIVKNDMMTIGLKMKEDEISKMKKEKFKTIAKSKTRAAALTYLNKLKQTHSKLSGISYNKHGVQTYLTSPLFNNESRNLLFRLRTRTVSGIRNDFRGVYPDTNCPLGCLEIDTLSNILKCKVLLTHHRSSEISTNNIVEYEDVFSPDTKKQKQATELYQQLLQIRNEILSQPVLNTGPMHRSNTL